MPRTHANISALSARVFRPGSGTDSDDLLRLALERWDAIDARAGFAIDHRAVCAFLAEDDQVADLLGRIARRPRDETRGPGRNWSCSACCGRGRTHAAPKRCGRPAVSWRTRLSTERTLLADVLPAGPPAVDVDDERLAR